MKFFYYDSRLSVNMRQRWKKPDLRQVVSISLLTNRIYVTIKTFQCFNLGNHRMSIVQDKETQDRSIC